MRLVYTLLFHAFFDSLFFQKIKSKAKQQHKNNKIFKVFFDNPFLFFFGFPSKTDMKFILHYLFFSFSFFN